MIQVVSHDNFFIEIRYIWEIINSYRTMGINASTPLFKQVLG